MARQDRATACTRDRESVVGLHRARLRARAARCARHEGHMHTTWCACATRAVGDHTVCNTLHRGRK